MAKKVIDICMYGCRGCNFSCKYCMGPEKTTEEFELDEKAILDSITKISNHKDNIKFIIWGGEPLLHFQELKKTFFFLKKNFENAIISFSTNGYLLADRIIQDFIIDNNIFVQLSCDGVAQYYRSSFDPLNNNQISLFLAELSHKNLLSINCIMHKKNSSINENIKYFVKWMKKYNCLKDELSIRFTPINESKFTEEFNFSGDDLSLFIHEYEMLFIQLIYDIGNTLILHHFSQNLRLVNENNLRRCDSEHANGCTMFKMKVINYSNHIDTKGKFVSCNLIDSGIDPRGELIIKQPDYCLGCKFNGCKGCFPCPAADYPQKCEFKKSWLHSAPTNGHRGVCERPAGGVRNWLKSVV